MLAMGGSQVLWFHLIDLKDMGTEYSIYVEVTHGG
jgi:hypothetical protein